MHRDNNYDLEATRRKLPTLVAGVTGIEDICAASIVTRTVKWEWPGRIPKGKVTMADGDPGQGKSAVTMDIAARKSAGRAFPDGAPCEAGNVLICNVEDDAADTIVPRLKAHGADLSRVFLFSEVPDGSGGRRLLELPRDLEPLKAKVIERRIELLILDPVLTMLGGDANKDQDARKALTPIKHMAEETEVAVILVRHLNKSVGLKAIQRGGGNMGLIGVARAGMFFGDHPEDDGLHVMAVHKSNLAEKPPSLGYRIVTSAVHDTARVEWTGAVDLDANALAANNGGQDKTVLDEAKEFLRDELGDGPIFARQVLKDARDAGVADITLRRAKTSLGVKSTRHGTEGWTWELPTRKDDPPRDHDFSKDNLERLEHVDHLGGDQGEKGRKHPTNWGR